MATSKCGWEFILNLRKFKVKIVTWNVNSIRARLPIVVNWVQNNQRMYFFARAQMC